MKLIIAAGGTGGHVIPAIAVAQALKKIDPNSEVLFIGTEIGIEKNLVPKAGFAIEYIKISGLKGRSLKKQLLSLFEIPFSIFKSIQILRRVKPDAIIGVGGYVSGPALLAAFLLRIPAALIEPNSIPGFTNRVLAPLVKVIFGAFNKTAQYFPKKRFIAVGSPLTTHFEKLLRPPERSLTPFKLLVFGGSRGARALNICLPRAISIVKRQIPDLAVTHQTGPNEFEKVQQSYHSLGITAHVTPFIHDPMQVYAKSNLIVCRAGASTCSEISAMGLPAILIPFPQAIDDHQTENARELELAGSATILPQSHMTPESLSEMILNFINHPTWLNDMSQNALKIAKTDAAEQIAQSALRKFKPS